MGDFKSEWWEVSAVGELNSCYYWLKPSITMSRVYGVDHEISVFQVKAPDVITLWNKTACMERAGNHILHCLLEEQGFREWLEREWASQKSRLRSIADSVDSKQLKSLPNDNLRLAYQNFSKAFLEFYEVGMIIEPMYFSLDPKLKREISKLIGKPVESKDVALAVASVSTPATPSFASVAESELREIATQAVVRGLKDTLTGKMPLCALQDAWLESALQKYACKWHWIQNTYATTGRLSVEDACLRLAEELKSKRPPGTTSFKPAAVRLTDPKSEKLTGLAAFLTVFQDERKEETLRALSALHDFLHEFAGRFNVGFSLVRQATPPEILSWFLGVKPDLFELEARTKLSVSIASKKGVDVYSGEKALQVLEKNVGEGKQAGEFVEVRGTCASSGTAVGIARLVVDPLKVKRFDEGDVLIASMTQPNFMPLMKKACAIVTDEGGITCHAAIVSREFGIPCVIATRLATKTFKDGDLVEVKADHGLARKVTRNA